MVNRRDAISKSTTQDRESSTNQRPEQVQNNTIQPENTSISSSCSGATYQSRYYGTPFIPTVPLSYGYTHLSPETQQVETLIPSITPPSYSATSQQSSSHIPVINPNSSQQEVTTSIYRRKKSPNPLPRHKRESHINAEYRRRNKIQIGFDTLKNMVPSLKDSHPGIHQKESKSTMLYAAVEYSRELKAICDENEREEQRLKQEIHELELDIQRCQKGLPVGGVEGQSSTTDTQLHNMLQDYLYYKMNENWKFWIFSFLVRRLFSSFIRMVTSSSYSSFLQSVQTWSDENLHLNKLRPGVIDLLKYISTNTSVMTNPDQLPRDAYLDYKKWKK